LRTLHKPFISGIPPAILEEYMPKVTVEIPQHIIDDVNAHVGDGQKFVSFSDAVRTALRKMLDQLDEIDRRRGRISD
jgi:Arc/MetJ-type ribon-helix-helix transcriptional regulator